MIAIPAKPIALVSSNAYITPDAEYQSGTTYAKDSIVYVKERVAGDPSSYVGVIFQSIIDQNTADPVEDTSAWRAIGYLEYEAGRVYPENATVVLEGNRYLSQEINNDTSPLSHNSKWSSLGKDNAHACLDYYFTTATTKIGESLVMTLAFQRCDTLSLFGLYGSFLQVEQLDESGNVIQTNIIPHTDPASISDFASWMLFGSVGGVTVDGTDIGTYQRSLVDTSMIHDFASWLRFVSCDTDGSAQVSLIKKENQQVRITIEPKPYKGALIAELASVTAGEKRVIGCTMRGLTSRRISLRPPKRDKWGDIEDGGDDYVKIYTAKAMFDTEDIDYMDSVIDLLFNQPATYYLTDDRHQAFNTFGMMQDNELSLENASKTGMPVKIESFKYKKNNKEC